MQLVMRHSWLATAIALSLLVGCSTPHPTDVKTATDRTQTSQTRLQGDERLSAIAVQQYQYDVRFAADGAHYDQTIALRALSAEGAQRLVKRVFPVNTKLENVDVIEAYTLKANGQQLAVKPDQIRRQQGVITANASPGWDGVDLVEIKFPDVQVGDEVVTRTRSHVHSPALPGWHSARLLVDPTVPTRGVSGRIQAPSNMHLQVASQGMAVTHRTEGDQEIWQFQHDPSAAISGEALWVNTIKQMPYISASTYPTLEALGDAFAHSIASKAQATVEVRERVAELTRGLPSDEAKAKALFTWVRDNIRYVAVYLGSGGFVPHDIAWILDKRYGDCKDHALLLQTMLAEAGIEAAPALISTVPDYTEAPVAIPAYNHVITYIPVLNRFVDATQSKMPFDALHFADSDKPVLVGLKTGTQRMRTPAFTADQNRLVVSTEWAIDAQGNARASMKAEGLGQTAAIMQDVLEKIPPVANGIAVSKMLSQAGWNGKGFLRYSPIQREQQTQSLAAEAEIRQLVADPTSGHLDLNQQLTRDALSISRNMGNFQAESRRFDMLCTPVSVRENFSFKLDPSYQILKVPSDFSREIPGRMHFEAHYTQQGNTVSGWREFRRTQNSHVCTVEQYATDAPVYREVAQHLRSQMLFTQ